MQRLPFSEPHLQFVKGAFAMMGDGAGVMGDGAGVMGDGAGVMGRRVGVARILREDKR